MPRFVRSASAVALLSLATLWSRALVAQDARVDIGGTATRVALANCPVSMVDPARLSCGVVREVLKADLEFEGLQLIPENLIRGLSIQDPRTPTLIDWRAIGANLLITFDATQVDSSFSADIRLFNVASGHDRPENAAVLNRRYTGTIEPGRPESLRVYAHQAADEILALAQIPSIARTRLAFVSDRDFPDKLRKELYIADYDGFNVRRITRSDALNILPNWTPGGRGLIYTSYRSGSPHLFLAWIYEGRGVPNVTRESASVQAFAPAISPDGTRIAYSANRGGNFDIWVANIDGSNARNLTASRAEDTAPCWSPSGLEIGFTSNRGGSPQIWVMDSEGLGLRRLSTYGNYSDACAWNPSREFAEVAFSSRIEDRGFEIAVVDLVTGQTRQLTTGRGECEYPSWSPNGRHLVFACNRGGTWQLTQSDRLGRKLRQIAVGPGNSRQPDWSQAPAAARPGGQ
jgi:TolB protein